MRAYNSTFTLLRIHVKRLVWCFSDWNWCVWQLQYNGGTQLLSAEYVSARLGEVRHTAVFHRLGGRIHRVCYLFLGDGGKEGVHADGTRLVFCRRAG